MANSLADIIVGKSANWLLEISMFDKNAVAKSIAKKLGKILFFRSIFISICILCEVGFY